MLTQLTNSLTLLIQNLYGNTGLAGIMLAMAIESCCIPLPSEIVMPLAGIIIASFYTSHPLHLPGTSPSYPLWVNLTLAALAGSLGCLLGSIAAYGIGASGGRPLMLKYGRYILISQHDANKADEFFHKWGSATAFFSRLLPVIRTYISLPAGIAKMPFGKFCLYTFLGSFPWCLLLAYIGTVVGNNSDKLAPYFHTFDVLILVILVILVGLYIWRHIRNDRKARAELTLSEGISKSPSTQQQQGGGQQPFPSQQSGWPPHQSQQAWGQSPQSQQAWNQQNQMPQPQNGWQQSQPQQAWGQQPQQPQQPQQSPQNGEQAQPPQNGWQHHQQGWVQSPQSWPPFNGDNERTVRRN